MTGVEMRKMGPRRERESERVRHTYKAILYRIRICYLLFCVLFILDTSWTQRFIVIKYGSPHTCTLFSQLHSMAQTIICLCVFFILFSLLCCHMRYNCWCNSSPFTWNYGHSKLSFNKNKQKTIFKYRSFTTIQVEEQTSCWCCLGRNMKRTHHGTKFSSTWTLYLFLCIVFRIFIGGTPKKNGSVLWYGRCWIIINSFKYWMKLDWNTSKGKPPWCIQKVFQMNQSVYNVVVYVRNDQWPESQLKWLSIAYYQCTYIHGIRE